MVTHIYTPVFLTTRTPAVNYIYIFMYTYGCTYLYTNIP